MTAKEQFAEMTEHLCLDSQPSAYLQNLLETGQLKQFPFIMLSDLQKTPQSPIHHPEGNVWNHMCMVVDQAAKIRQYSSNPKVLMWAALLHDIGKPATTQTRRGRITSYDHEKLGMKLSVEFLSPLTEDSPFIEGVSKLIRYHMQPLFIVKDMPFAELSAMRSETDIKEVALLGYCDRMGRTGSSSEAERGHILKFLQKCGIEDISLEF